MEEELLRKKLSEQTTLAGMLNVLYTRYDLNNKLGLIQKPIIIEGLIKAYKLLKPNKRNES
jgi:hypothetical protein